MRNKRYIFWFWLLDFVFGFLGTSAFRDSARPILEHSAYSDRLLRGFDLSVMFELYARPEFGSMAAVSTAAVCFAVAFFLVSRYSSPASFRDSLPATVFRAKTSSVPVAATLALHSLDDHRWHRHGNRHRNSVCNSRCDREEGRETALTNSFRHPASLRARGDLPDHDDAPNLV